MDVLRLSSPVTDIPRIGPSKAKYLSKLGITHVRDFLYNFPRRHDDFSVITNIEDLKNDQVMTVKGAVKSVKTSYGFRGRQKLFRIFVKIEDDTGVLDVTWYNLRFLPKQLWQGRQLFVSGKAELGNSKKSVNFRMRSPVMEFITDDPTHTARITPVYPETYGVTSRFLRYQVKQVLPTLRAIPEYLPQEIIDRNNLISIHQAIEAIHFPEDADQLAKANQRLHFDELFFLQLAALDRRRTQSKLKATPIKSSQKHIKEFTKILPFKLTKAQEIALADISKDLKKGTPMNRLLQGDVGSGKSVVAQFAAFIALANRHTVFYLAPTEVLARQQAKSFASVLGQDKVHLLIGALKNKEKEAIKQELTLGQSICVVGTHALLQEGIVSKNCTLAIIDEQHRFGVRQRKALQNVSGSKNMPHLLSMTATPIPRTLNLTVFGDLDISVLDELPPNRLPVKTKVIAPNERDQVIIHVLNELHEGKQVYVVSPLVEKSEKLAVKSAKETVAEMKQLFPDIAIDLLHGQMPSEEKETVLNNFTAGAIQLLVATAVVEVGVDVPNASVIIIEGAERFGLAQLHQFRGRVGRGVNQSYCYLFPSNDAAAKTPRLIILASTNDGFKIAEEDLKQRGPGEAYGKAQSGFGNLKIASLLDYPTIKLARAEAEIILAKDPNLTKYPILRKKVKQKNELVHFE